MRPSLTDIQQTEQYLLGKMKPEDALLFEVRLLTNPVLKANMQAQQRAYTLLKLYNRKKLKQEAEAVHNRLFGDPAHAGFQQKIKQLFNP